QYWLGRRRRLARNKRADERDREIAPKNFKCNFAFNVQRPRSRQFTLRLKFEKICRPVFELHRCAKACDEPKRIELNQDVVTDVTLNTEAACLGEEFGFRAPLQRIRRDGEVTLSPQT